MKRPTRKRRGTDIISRLEALEQRAATEEPLTFVIDFIGCEDGKFDGRVLRKTLRGGDFVAAEELVYAPSVSVYDYPDAKPVSVGPVAVDE